MDDQASIGGRAYQALKARVTSGEFRPGERLEPPRLVQEIDASLTTIYNALRHLAVERLVESHRSGGFHIPRVTEVQLRGTYHWICSLACLAVDNAAPAIGGARRPWSPFVPADADVTTRTELLFDEMAALPEVDEYREAMGQANDRIRPVRRLETHVLPDLESEFAQLIEAASEPERLNRLLAEYRDRRVAAVPDLARLRIRGIPGLATA
jgi:DNA-binding transcriptional MocR family regulator